MPVVKITGQGLAAIALSVALLWGCWIETRVTMDRSRAERARVLHDLKLLRQERRPEPVSLPAARQRKVHSLLS
ncbi:MAG: hypothetical protein P4L56_30175 [Candidatus Sulfopaludibacter sp.]|nr:hypothetical protein [Candidatus Sulfopaludibacter sp.]